MKRAPWRGNYIYVMNADGSGQVNLSRTKGVDDSSPDWSPAPSRKG